MKKDKPEKQDSPVRDVENKYIDKWKAVEDLPHFHGICRSREFFCKADAMIDSLENKKEWCMAALDIEHFKMFNEWYGYEEGNNFLREICRILNEIENKFDAVAGYLQADNYVLFLSGPLDYLAVVEDIYKKIIMYLETVDHMVAFYPAIGIYIPEDTAISTVSAYDRAAIAMSSIKGNYAVRISMYKEEMYQELEREHRVLLEIQNAIGSGEIIYHIQPKCNLMSGKIVGSEALVRWRHPIQGMISPADFIPVLEKNGLIGRIDLAVWRQVCRDLRSFIDSGEKPLPVSVNLSRIDIYTLDVVGELLKLTAEYEIDHSLIEIEITESSISEDYSALQKLTDELSGHGFKILMDDFGSGYSSLNMLKDINVDIIKIDLNFLKLDETNSGRGVGILESVINIARLLNVSVIAEGVETDKHLEVLQDVGCIYAQGYYYYRPMPKEEFYELLKNDDLVDRRGVSASSIEHIDLTTLIKNQEISISIVDKILGAFAFFSYDGKKIVLERVNQSYCKMLQESRIDIEEYRHDLLGKIHKSDRKAFLRTFEEARKDVISGSCTVYRYTGKQGGWIWLEMRLFLLKDMNQHQMFYAKIRDVSEHKKKQEELERSQKALMNAIHITEHDREFQEMAEENQNVATALYSGILPGGIIGGYCEPGFPLFFISNEMIRLMEYDSYDDFCACTKEFVENTIFVDDREKVAKDIGPVYYEGLTYTTIYRMVKKDGSMFWTLDKGRVVRDNDGKLAILSVCIDVTEVMERQEELREQIDKLTRLNGELYYLQNQMPGGYHRCSAKAGFPFLYISERFLDIFGYTRQEIKELFDDKFENMVHPNDRKGMNAGVDNILKTNEMYSFEYRMKAKHGYIWVIDQSCFMEYGEDTFFHGMITDVTEIVTLKNRLQFIMKSTKDDIVMITYRAGKMDFEIIAGGFNEKHGYSEKDFLKFLYKFHAKSTDKNSPYYDLNCRVQKDMAAKKDFHEIVNITVQGASKWIYVKGEYLDESDGASRFLCTLSDITEQRKQEDMPFNPIRLTSVFS